ncbi:MAG TPA: FAD-dependent oxidoreductase [Gemmatimonadales bacterium]|nr:FAD-dependent oxidoreductase [Gemmatimonadales bacterium]
MSVPDLTLGTPSSELREGQTLLGHADGEQVLLARCGDGLLYAVGARCTHYGGPLEEGLVVGDTVRCPWHHAAFNLKTGRNLRPPALNHLPRWSVEERDGVARVTSREAAPSSAEAAPSGTLGREPARALPHEPASVVIVGGGAAGAVAALTLRREGYTGPVTILDEGHSPPCDRPNLSKDYLAGNAPEEWIPLFPDSWYEENDIDLQLGAHVRALDTQQRRLTLEDGTDVPFGSLLIATGAHPITLPLENSDRIMYLRTLADSRAIIKAAEGARAVAVIGASFIGLEVAASLRARGLKVTVIAPEERPLERILGPELGDFVRELHESKGVEFRLRQTVTGLDDTHVTLEGGDRLEADLVVAGIGVQPNIRAARDAGLRTDRGVMVNEFLETDVKDIFAAGDVARWPSPVSGEPVRIEHWVVAQRQAVTAARNILGFREPFTAVPFFWSQHYDVTIAYVGHASRWDRHEVKGSIQDHDCEVRYWSGSKLLALASIFRDRTSLEVEVEMERRFGRDLGRGNRD